METALQPCGFLSAYLDTYSFAPDTTFFFRNLDGTMRFSAPMDVRGKTITTQARLLSSVAGGGTVIQKFAYTLTCAGQPLCSGESSFGYFSGETMANQIGLDGGRSVLPAIHAEPGLAGAAVVVDARRLQTRQADRPHYRLASDRLHFLQDIRIVPGGGRYGGGYVYASRPVNPQDWFYPFHFYQDPVMPGSLGVEAMVEAVQAYALEMDLGGGLRSPRFGLAPAENLSWSYRGQITQQHKLMELEVHLKPAEHQPGRVALTGDASLWVDGLRIYAVKNAGLGILEA
jgi:3-hydroxymyristoyl/3-hydroxydecanoyl-(acyl carrier protein) dehydratase